MQEERWEEESYDEGDLDYGFAPWQATSAETATIKTAQQLLVVDAFWTNELSRLEQSSRLSRADTEMLEEAAIDLQLGLSSIRPLASALGSMFEHEFTDQDIERALNAIAEQPELGSSLVDLGTRWRDALEGTSFRDAVI